MPDCAGLAQEIAEIAHSVDKLQHAWLTRIREFDAIEGWATTGCVSMVAWLAWWTGTGHKAASEHVRVARALGRLPLVDHAFESGELSYSKVRAITRIAEPEQQQSLIDLAKGATASQLEKIVAAMRRVRAFQGPEHTAVRKTPRRYVHVSHTDEGMVRITAQVGPEEALVLEAAMTTANSSAEESSKFPVQRAGESSAEDWGGERVDALIAVARGYLARKPATRGSGFDLIMMTTPERLAEGSDGVGGFLRDGTPLPLHVARMLACDAQRIDVQVGQTGELLDVGRSRRTIPTPIGRALALRDGGCRVPGCGRTRHLEAHHVQAWAEGGDTAVDNLTLLCPGHHLAVHEGRLHVEVRAGEMVFRNIHGVQIEAAPRHGIDPETIASLIDAAACSGEHEVRWDGERLDLHEVVDWMMHSEGFYPSAHTH